MKNVVITGGTGLVGRQLTSLLLKNNYQVTILSRITKLTTKDINYSCWNIENQVIDVEVISKADYIIHLAGEGIADKRWTKTQQEKILKSRVEPLKLIYGVLSSHKNQLKALISASGVGYYGAITSPQIFNEEDQNYNDFLGKTCKEWESAVDIFNELHVRTVKLRTGIVLSKSGGALEKMLLPFKWHLGSALGTGKQFMPWIHIDDLCNMYLTVIQNNDIKGAYNAVVDDGTTNMIFSQKLAKHLKKTIFLPNLPSIVLQLVLGKMSALLLQGSRVSNKKIKETGFVFKYEDLDKALSDLV